MAQQQKQLLGLQQQQQQLQQDQQQVFITSDADSALVSDLLHGLQGVHGSEVTGVLEKGGLNTLSGAFTTSDWPYIPQLLQVHSLDFSHAFRPSVDKATEHLQLVQDALYAWQKDRQRKLSSSEGMAAALEEAETSNVVDVNPQSKVGTGQLEQVDMSLSVQGDTTSRSMPPFLGVKDVIEEVIVLLARLERDRQETEEMLNSETLTVERLTRDIDVLAADRLNRIAAAVQREHETYSTDIEELNFHLTQRRKTEAVAGAKVKEMERADAQIRQEIDDIKKYTPLVEEKLKLEQECIERITSELETADAELSDVRAQYATAARNFKDVDDKSTLEKSIMQKEQASKQAELESVRYNLNEARNLMSTYEATMLSDRLSIEELRAEIPLERQRYIDSKKKHSAQTKMLAEINRRVAEAQEESVALENEKFEANRVHQQQKVSNAAAIKELKADVAEKENIARQLTQKNQELEMINGGLLAKVANCDVVKLANVRNLERIDDQLRKTADANRALTKQVTGATKTRDKLAEDQRRLVDRNQKEEQVSRSNNDSVRETIAEERSRQKVLKSKIESGAVELSKMKEENEVKRTIMDRKVQEVDKAVATVLEKVEKLRELRKDQIEKIDHLTAAIQDIERQEEVEVAEYEAQLMVLTPEEANLKAELKRCDREMEEMDGQMKTWAEAVSSMELETIVIDRTCDKMHPEIDTLQCEQEELSLRLESAKKIKTDLLESLRQIEERSGEAKTQHLNLMTNRTAVLSQLQADLIERKEENRKLASSYRTLQNECMTAEQEFQKETDKQLQLERRVQEAGQVIAVQDQVHGALQEFYRCHRLYNGSEISRLQADSQENNARILALQKDLETAVKMVDEFMLTKLTLFPTSDSVTAT